MTKIGGQSGEADDDPFVIVGPVPRGQAYQWIAVSAYGDEAFILKDRVDYEQHGWKPVLRKRHPRMRSEDRTKIVLRGQMLCQRPLKTTMAASAADVAKAKEQKRLSDEMMRPGEGAKMGFLPSSAVVAEAYDSRAIQAELALTNGKVVVQIAIRLTEGEIDAAAACRLTASEYARRKVLLIEQLSVARVLAPVSEGVFEFAELTLKRPSDKVR